MLRSEVPVGSWLENEGSAGRAIPPCPEYLNSAAEASAKSLHMAAAVEEHFKQYLPNGRAGHFWKIPLFKLVCSVQCARHMILLQMQAGVYCTSIFGLYKILVCHTGCPWRASELKHSFAKASRNLEKLPQLLMDLLSTVRGATCLND